MGSSRPSVTGAGVFVHVPVPPPVEEAGGDQRAPPPAALTPLRRRGHGARGRVHDRLAREQAGVADLRADGGRAIQGVPVVFLQPTIDQDIE